MFFISLLICTFSWKHCLVFHPLHILHIVYLGIVISFILLGCMFKMFLVLLLILQYIDIYHILIMNNFINVAVYSSFIILATTSKHLSLKSTSRVRNCLKLSMEIKIIIGINWRLNFFLFHSMPLSYKIEFLFLNSRKWVRLHL